MKKIVILGGGFAGVTTGITILKNLNKDDVEITLIDENNFHTFKPSLYEVATSEEPQKNIAIPLKNIFSKKVNLVKNRIERIDIKKQDIILSNGNNIPWDYLAICLGAQTNYYSIPGLEKHSFPLNSLKDAVEIKNELIDIGNKNIQNNQQLNIIIGGGGFSGIELAAEIVNFRNNYKKNNFNLKKILNITILEANEQILNGLDSNTSSITRKRLNSFDVKIINSCLIKEVEPNQLKASDNQKYPYDILIWTGGIKGNTVLEKSNFPIHKSGRIPVNEFLQSQESENIYAAGDCTLFLDPKTQRAIPQTGQIATGEGMLVGKNIASQVLGKKLTAFKMKNYNYIIPLKGRYAIADLRFIKLFGLLGWFLQQIVFLRYLLMILPLSRALKKWNRFELELKQE